MHSRKFNVQTLLLIVGILFLSSIRMLSQDNSQQKIDANKKQAEEYLQLGNKVEAARIYNQTAYLLRNAQRYNEAIEYYKKVLELNTELGNKVGLVLTHSNLSVMYIQAGNFEQALPHLQYELKSKEKSKKIAEIIPVLITIANTYNELGQFQNGVDNAIKAVQKSQEINSLAMLKRSYGTLNDIYTKWGKQSEAQKYFDLYSTIDKKIKEDKMAEIQTEAKQQVNAANTDKAKTQEELNETSEVLEKTTNSLLETEQIARQQQIDLELEEAKNNALEAQIQVQKYKSRFLILALSGSLLFILVLGFLILRIRKANNKIELQKGKLEKQNREIKSSIRYANTIQTAMLPDLNEISDFTSYFVIFKPKDIVSGDFYWSSVSGKTMFFAVVDCTGHGVPGAFMSMIGMRMLNEIVNEMKIDSPAIILETLNKLLRNALRQEQTDNNDGMDLGICRFDKLADGTTKMVYSGAKRPAYVGRKGKYDLETLNPDRKSIGGYQPAKRFIEFSNQEIILQPGDNVYLFSDGIVDQNDPYRKKFGRARLENILSTCNLEDTDKQQEILTKKIDEFIKDESQRDDITITGLKIK